MPVAGRHIVALSGIVASPMPSPHRIMFYDTLSIDDVLIRRRNSGMQDRARATTPPEPGNSPAANPVEVEVTARFFSGLADPTRLRIVTLLLERPHTVGAIVGRLGLRQSRVSNALVCRKWCGYLE